MARLGGPRILVCIYIYIYTICTIYNLQFGRAHWCCLTVLFITRQSAQTFNVAPAINSRVLVRYPLVFGANQLAPCARGPRAAASRAGDYQEFVPLPAARVRGCALRLIQEIIKVYMYIYIYIYIFILHNIKSLAAVRPPFILVQ